MSWKFNLDIKNMELKINVDETKFGQLINDELSNFTQEEIHEICRDGLIKIMSDQETLKRILPQESKYWSDYVSVEKLMKTAVEKIDISPLFSDFEEKARSFIHDNYKNLILEAMTQALINGLSDYMTRSSFMDIIRSEVHAHMR